MATSSKPRKDVEETVAGIRRQVRALEPRAADEDPWVVAEMLDIAAELEAAAARTVARLRAAGYTWTDIGFALGISRSGAYNRFAAKIK